MKRSEFPFYKNTNIRDLIEKYKNIPDETARKEAIANELHNLYDITTEDAMFEVNDYFRIEKMIQEEHDLSNKFIYCPVCETKISREAESCPNCGHPLKQKESGISFWVIVGAVIVGVIIASFF